MVSRLFGSLSRSLGSSGNFSANQFSVQSTFTHSSSVFAHFLHASAVCLARRVLVGTVVSDKPMKSGDFRLRSSFLFCSHTSLIFETI